MNKFNSISKDEMQEIINQSTSISEVLRKIGLVDYGSNHTRLVSFLKQNDFNTSTLVGRKINRQNKKGVPKKRLSELLTKNSTTQSSTLKKRLIREGLKDCKCEICGLSKWEGYDLSLELHHINGDHYDNRLHNLIILCPNCHSLTTNFRGKNSSIDIVCKNISEQTADDKMKVLIEREEKQKQRKHFKETNKKVKIQTVKSTRYCKYCGKEILGDGLKYCSVDCMNKEINKNKPTKEDLLEKSKEFSSLQQMAVIYNLTSNGLKKWLVNYGIYDVVKENFKQRSFPIIQFSMNLEFIKEWKDANEIEKVLGFNKSHIQQTCRGYQKSSNNFIWKYKKDIN